MTTRTEIADAFRAARVHITIKSTQFICVALPHTEAGRAAEAIILERMGPVPADVEDRGSFTLCHWLYHQGVNMNAFDDHAMRMYRIRWLDALIEEFDE